MTYGLVFLPRSSEKSPRSKAGQLTGPRDLAKVLRLPGPHTFVTLFTLEVDLKKKEKSSMHVI